MSGRALARDWFLEALDRAIATAMVEPKIEESFLNLGVYVVKDGKAHEQRVRTGLRVGDKVEILEGVAAGDSIIISPGGLADGSTVTVSE